MKVYQLNEEQFTMIASDLAEIIGKLESSDDHTGLVDTLKAFLTNSEGILSDNEEMIKLSKQILAAYNQLDNNSSNNVELLHRDMDKFIKDLRDAIEKSVEQIAFDGFDKQIEDVLGRVVKSLEKNVATFQSHALMLKTTNDRTLEGVKKYSETTTATLTQMTGTVKADMMRYQKLLRDATGDLEKARNAFWIWTSMALLMVGLIVGFLGATWWGVALAKEQLLTEQQRTLDEIIERRDAVRGLAVRSEGVRKFILEHEINVESGTFSDTGEPYLRFKTNDVTANFKRDGYTFISVR